MLKPPHEVESIAASNKSCRVIWLSEEDQDSVSVSESALVVVTAQLGLGSQGQHVGVVWDDAAGSVEISHGSPVLVDLNMTINAMIFSRYFLSDILY